MVRPFPSVQSLGRHLVQGAIGTIGLKGLAAALHLAINVLLARNLTVAEFGVYSYVLALVSILAIPAHAGIPTLIVRLTATFSALRQWGLLAGLWRRTTQLVLIVSLGVAMLALLANILVPRRDVTESLVLTTLIFGLLAVPITSIVETRSAALRGLGHVVLGQTPESFIRPLAFCLLIGVASSLPGVHLSAAIAMALHLASAALALVFALATLRAARPPETRAAEVEYRSREWLASIVPLSMLAGAQVLLQQTDTVMLGLFEDYDTVAIYRVAAQTAAIVSFGLMAAGTVLSPFIARMYALGEKAQVQRMITLSSRVVFATALSLTLMLWVFGETFLSFAFGKHYVEASSTLLILCVGLLLKSAAGPGGVVLTMTGHERQAFFGVASATIANIVLNLILIPPYGVEGAAAASALAFAIWSVQVTRLAHKMTGFDTTVVGAWRRSAV